MPCEIHSAIFHPLELANLHVSAAIRNSDWFEVLWPMDPFAFGLAGRLPVTDGFAILPGAAGLGMDIDHAAIDAATIGEF